MDAKISRDAGVISSDYEAIVALSVRQALASCELTVGRDSWGKFNQDDVLYFLKGTLGGGGLVIKICLWVDL